VHERACDAVLSQRIPMIPATIPSFRNAGAAPAGLRGLLWAGFCLSLLLPTVFALLVWYDLDRENAYASERAQIVAQAVQRQLVERLDWLAAELQETAERASLNAPGNAEPSLSAAPPDADDRGLGTVLQDLVLLRAGGAALDAQGKPIDRASLPKPDRDAQPAGLAIGVPVHGANARWLVPVAWTDASGAGLAARIDADWFAKVLLGYDLGNKSMLNLMHRDRVMLARSLSNQQYVGTRMDGIPIFDAAHRDLAKGTYIETTTLDRVPRQIVFQRVAHTPLIIVVGSPRKPLLAEWRRFSVPAFGVALLLGALWFWLSHAFARSHARQTQLLADLRAQSLRGEEARRIAKLGDWTWNLETGEVIWSPEIYAICGLPPSDAPLRIEEIPERIHPDDRERMHGYLSRALGGGELSETEYRIVRPDGEVRVVYARAEWVDRTPGQRMLRGIQQDITELADTRQRLREAEDEYRYMFEHNPLPMWVFDRETLRFLAVNDAMLASYGYTRDELLTASLLDIRPAEDAEAVIAIARMDSEQRPQGLIWTHLRKDGSRLRAAIHTRDIRFEEREARLVLALDVTERERSEQRFQLVARATSDAIWDWDLETDVTWRSDNAYALFGYARDEKIGSTLEVLNALLHPDDRIRVRASLDRAIASDRTDWEDTYRLQRKDGSYAEVLDRALILRDAHDRAIRMVGGMLDVTQKHRDEADLRLLRRAVESADNGILIADARLPDVPAVYVNRAFEKMTGYAAAEIIGSACRYLQDADEPEFAAVRQAIAEQREVRVLLRDHRKDGELYWNDFYLAPVRDAAGVLTHFVSIQSDVTERQRILEQLAYRATYDELTGLPNRQLLTDRLQQGVLNAERYGRGVGVLFVDLDEFKLINDSLGHSAGDEVLRVLARRFEKAVRSPDTLGRFGGDEFVVILTEEFDEDGVGRVIERISGALAESVDIAGAPHYITASIGYCRYPDAGTDAETLLKKADLAMYQAKQRGRNRAIAYHADFDAGISERLHLASALRDAVQREEFCMEFQPLFDRDGAAVGLEALLRWRHPERGMLEPAQFIGVCEDSGLIVPLGRWVLHEAARHHALLTDAGFGHLRIAVNVSAVQFQQNLYEDVYGAIDTHAVRQGALELELTESAIMANPETAIGIMQRLDRLGVSISVDDFGTGYSSLAYLKRLPIDRLKIDRSFVDHLGQDDDDDAICTSIINLAHSLGLHTVAEGVETEQQLEWLRARGCDEMQGYLLGRPLPFDEALQALRVAAVTQRPDLVA
jgi:diguanylate cyclase (GGDEF)-like protein/PAS domain S-box-containing protein